MYLNEAGDIADDQLLRILIVKTSSLGDVIHMLPAVTDAARTRPAWSSTGWSRRASRRFRPGIRP